MRRMRFIDLGYISLPMLHATEEAIAITGEPTFLLWIASPPTVNVGYFQSVEQEVNIKACEELGLTITRRPSGGGAVLFDERELYYSIVAKPETGILPKSASACFKRAGEGLINALKIFGLEGVFTGVNDVQVFGKKISGNAQTNMHGAKVQHGTFLVDFDMKTMLKVLKIPKEKIADKEIKFVEERMITLKKALGRDVSMEEAKDALLKGFQEALNVEFYKGELSEEEKALAKKFVRKYESKEWTFRR